MTLFYGTQIQARSNLIPAEYKDKGWYADTDAVSYTRAVTDADENAWANMDDPLPMHIVNNK